MADDRELMQDILRAAAKLFANEAVRRRYNWENQYWHDKPDSAVSSINCAVQCLLLAERFEKGEKPVL